MGLGGGPRAADDYEWVRLADVPLERLRDLRGRRDRQEPLARAVRERLRARPPWPGGEGARLLLVDLDNLRAEPVRWRARMAAVLELAREADAVALAGQAGPAVRARPHLGDLATQVVAVPEGSDLADEALLAAAAAVDAERLRTVMMSNDGIFADLAERGPLVVLSPGSDALSDRLRDAAERVLDLAELEAELRTDR